MTLFIAVMHVPGIPERANSLTKLLERAPSAVVFADPERRGAWWNARRCWEAGIASGADWIVLLNDDALPCPRFEEAVTNALSVRDASDPVCLYTANERAPSVPVGSFYSTHDGLVGVGCALSRQAAQEFIAWVDAAMCADWTDDGRINLWAMSRRQLVYTTVPSLVDHQLPNSSLVGNAKHEARTATVPTRDDAADLVWTSEATHLGRHFTGNHWELVFRTKPETWDLEGVFLAERQGVPVSDETKVFIATPAYGGPKLGYLRSVSAIVADLHANGIQSIQYMTGGDSLVTRGRHHLMHDFLRSDATHFLQWDADVECEDATAVRAMLATGHGIIGGAYPWRDGSGRVVCNPLQGPGKHRVTISNDCIRVAEIGTGFLLVRRDVLIDLMMKHPELLYESDFPDYPGHPIWALFDVALEVGRNGRRRYASEDWRFCSLAREAGHETYVYVPPVFRHWGDKGHEGHILKAWRVSGVKEITEAAE